MQPQDPDQTRNMLFAVILSMAVLVAWHFLYAGPKMEAEQERQRQLARQQQIEATAKPGQSPAAAQLPGSAAPAGTSIVSVKLDRDTALAADKRVQITTPSIIGSINLKGARFDDITLVKYHVEPDEKSPRVTVFSPENAPGGYFAEVAWRVPQGSKVEVPGPETTWTQTGGSDLSPGNPIELTWTNPDGVEFKRTISIDPDYLVTVQSSITNNGSSQVTLFPAGTIQRNGTPPIEGFFIQHEGLIGVLGEKSGLQEISYSTAMDEDPYSAAEIDGGWLGFTDKYWASALIPEQSKKFNASLGTLSPRGTPRDAQRYLASFASQPLAITPGSEATSTTRLYVGAKKVDLIEAYQEKYNIRQFELMIDWGWFYFITKPLYYLIDWLYKLFGNFGVAILGVTIIVKALFFYFANKSYEAMAKMKKLQPQMEKIRDRYKDDKVEQQKQMMELYKTEKINPLAGCLPVLIQIPVFFALYKVLFISIDMRHAPFFGWIQDLSAPDPTTMFNLFGLLPYTVPEIIPAIGIWPLIMGITMWLQMQLNPQQPDPVQQAVFNWMPVLFTFLLATFPAGLVIYWTWNNILSIAQQYFIMKRQGVEVHLMDNLKKTAGAAKSVASAARKTAGDLKNSRQKSE